jgi:hypothetical protein
MSRIVGVVLTSSVMCGAANAAVLYTPPMYFAEPRLVSCNVVNLSVQSRTYTIEYFDKDGAWKARCAGTAPAGGASECIINPGAGIRYCKITMPDVTKANMRGGIHDPSTGASFPAE